MALQRKNLSSEKRRVVTVGAVVELAAKQNPGDITTDAIAKRMKVTQGALFRHFASKSAIWTAVMEWATEELIARVDRADKAATSPLAALEAVFAAHVEFIVKYPGIPRILLCELQRAEDTRAKEMVRTLVGRYGEVLRSIIERGKSQGEIAQEIKTDAAVTMFIGAIQGLVLQSLLAGDVRRIRKAAPEAFALCRRALRRSE